MNDFTNNLKEMRIYLLLWFTRMISGLGSGGAFLFACCSAAISISGN